jgi:hypothetical protein
VTTAGTAVPPSEVPPPPSTHPGEPIPPASPRRGRGAGSFIPTLAMITTKNLEMRKRRGLMIVIFIFTIGIPLLVLGIRWIFHAADPSGYGPPGTPDVFVGLADPMASFGFIVAATLGATAGTTDLGEGVFRNLVTTGRSRVALYLARIPAGLSIVLSMLAIGFTWVCLVTAFAGTPQPSSLSVQSPNGNTVHIPIYMSQAQLQSWLLDNPAAAQLGFGTNGGGGGGGAIRIKQGSAGNGTSGNSANTGNTGNTGVTTVPGSLSRSQEALFIKTNISKLYAAYTLAEDLTLNPPVNEMIKIGLWLTLELTLGFLIGLGFGTLIGQRTIAIIVMIVLELILTPIASAIQIPYFINGQRLLEGVAMDQLRPILISGQIHSGGSRAFGGRTLQIPPMPTWAMVAVIVGWIVVWTAVGIWRMATRDA